MYAEKVKKEALTMVCLVVLIPGLFLGGLTSCSTIPYTDTKEADALVDAGRYNEAVIEYSRAISLLPKNPRPYLGRGYAYEKLREYDKAIADYTKAVELAPTDPQVYFMRGLLYDLVGSPQQAIEDYSMSFRLNPSNADALYHRGLNKERLGDSQGALADFREAALRGNADAQSKLKGMGIKW